MNPPVLWLPLGSKPPIEIEGFGTNDPSLRIYSMADFFILLPLRT